MASCFRESLPLIYAVSKTLRSMQSGHFHIPIWKPDREGIRREAAHSHLAVLATTLKLPSDYHQLPQTNQFILVMGNEGNGISQEMAGQADQLVHIPMPGRAESLNIAVAAGILMFSLRILRKRSILNL